VNAAVVPLVAPARRPSLFLLFLGASLLLHGLGLLLASRARPEARLSPPRPSEVVVVEVEPKPPEPPPPTITLKRPRPAPKYSGEATKPSEAEPPPPNDTPPPNPGPPPPVVVGLTLQSTTTASAVAVPVGNTLAGKPTTSATAPGAVRPGYSPLYLVDTRPEKLEEIREYPREAQKLGIEGTVVLIITIEADGHVSAAHALSGPGYGLNEAAEAIMLRTRFKPATRGGKPVATDIRYTYDFILNQ
jgi:periplasmic protein TonB